MPCLRARDPFVALAGARRWAWAWGRGGRSVEWGGTASCASCALAPLTLFVAARRSQIIYFVLVALVLGFVRAEKTTPLAWTLATEKAQPLPPRAPNLYCLHIGIPHVASGGSTAYPCPDVCRLRT